jgi:hypothetical protein
MSASRSPLIARPASPVRRHDLLRDHDDLLRDHLLREHLIRDHGRTAQEIDGLPLADLHRFEHVEQALGLNDISHHHPAGPGGIW